MRTASDFCGSGTPESNDKIVFDLTQFYPTWLRPAFTVAIEEKYIEDYRDRFFIDPPLWFRGFSVLEGLYQLPLCLWAIPAILRSECFRGSSRVELLAN